MSQDYQLFAEIDDADDHDDVEEENTEERDENNHHASRGEMDQDDADVLAENTDASEEADTTTSADAESPEMMRRRPQRSSSLTDIIPTKRTKYTDSYGSTQDERWTSDSLATTTALSPVPKADENVSPNASHESTVAPFIHKEGKTNSQESSSDSLPDLIIEVEKKYSHDEPQEVYDELEKSMTKRYRKYILKIDEGDTLSMGSVEQRYATEFHSDHNESFFERSIKEVETTASSIAAETTGGSLIERIIDEWTVQSSPETNNFSKSLPPRTFSDFKGDDHDHSAEQRKDINSLSDEEVQALSESVFERSIKEVERTVSARAAHTTSGSLIERIIDEWTVQSSPETNNFSKRLPPRTFSDVKGDDHDHSAEQRKDINRLSDEEVQALSESFFERSIKEVERTVSARAAHTTSGSLIERIIDEWTVQSSPETNHFSKSLPPRTFSDVKGDDHDHSADVDTDDADDHVYARERERELEKRNITESSEEDAQTTSSREAEINDDNEEEGGEDNDCVISYKVRDTNDAVDYNDAEAEEGEKSNRNGSPGEMDQDHGDRLVENTDVGEAGEAASITGSTQDERRASDSLAKTTDASEEADTTTSADAESPEMMRRRPQRSSSLTDIIPTKRTKYTDSYGSTQDERWTSDSLAITTALSPVLKADENASPNTSPESTVASFIHKEGPTNSLESSSDSLPDLIIEVEKKYSHDEPQEVYDELEKSMTKLYRKNILKDTKTGDGEESNNYGSPEEDNQSSVHIAEQRADAEINDDATDDTNDHDD